ncbi:tandem C2 domains nuclear protein isoform X1 [Stegostoma tigrinum]|uniref:tandem C2 domains nuclear protein isoform X1 n=1 Tax=Stegostoma tigrinum TaxID=3053191 RepID=UPI00202B4270|nr:tandem C2 domains nuclear protein isoform X1 [Stegostoma tigrinum]XP_048393931.1 tandem C2 domains nuclear protein isoform X1 [Stegostoma tigrinum]XP_048393932.1 tandem C2 domains nuclear protein isoform X1 [Stegostoma tigrinum]XP_048393933.1 tandem C2 domains nuclear protein isoform X1 [Stegostoma tigrinum]XP_048393934.1 tandem C2 domains nuclear protein isoform X1 [Stegostoma tigrinum]XP_048393935.1 tandem C2 domains nuclear protein isoform X1 [Stegostoma tigrinum]XP_048393936.1 tandem C
MAGLQLVTPSPASLWLLIPVFIGLLLSVVLGLTADFLKSCCKSFSKDNEGDDSKSKVPREAASPPSKLDPSSGQKKIRFTEDVLLSKLPPDGREVHFVVPNLKPTYIQPGFNWTYEDTVPGFSRAEYTERKQELSNQHRVQFDEIYNPSFMMKQVTQGGGQHMLPPGNPGTLSGSAWELRSPKTSNAQGLSSSMFDLSNPQRMQRFSSTSSINSTISSLMDSQGSSRSVDTLADDFGKLNLKLSYRPNVEQIWINIVQIRDLYLRSKPAEKVIVYLKGTITLEKPVHFKSSMKDGASDLLFMETFVFNISLPSLKTHGLVINVMTQNPRKRIIGECSMSLRELSDVESNLWLDITPPSRTPNCHALLRVGTCFQAISNRIQLQILEAQNLPSSSTPLTLNFFVKAIMETRDGLFDKKKTRPLKAVNGHVKWGETFLFPVIQNELHLQRVTYYLKLYSRSSVRRKHFLGQVVIGWDSTGEALEQWQDMSANPEKLVIKWHNLNLS